MKTRNKANKRMSPKRERTVFQFQSTTAGKVRNMCSEYHVKGSSLKIVTSIGDPQCQSNQVQGGNNCTACMALFKNKN